MGTRTRRQSRIGALARQLVAVLLIGLMAMPTLVPYRTLAQDNGNENWTVRLKSREFVPVPGVEPAVVRQQQTASSGEQLHALVQFWQIPSEAERAALENAGVNLLAYVPTNAWFASMPAGLSLQSGALAGVRWIGAIQPEDRMAPTLRAGKIGPHAAHDDGTVSLDVRFFADVTNAEVAQIVARHNGVIETQAPEFHRFTVRFAPGTIEALANEDGVQWITDAAPPKTIDNDGVRVRTNVDVVQAAPYDLSGSGVDLGEWDGGRVDTHVDFSGRLTVVDSGASIIEHATHVAGTMAGDGSNSASQGGSPLQWRGMAPGADIISYYWDNNLTDHYGAINTYGIELSQNSWGYDVAGWRGNCHLYGDYDYDAPDYDDIITGLYGKRISVIFAAGNERNDGDCGMSGIPPYINYANVGPPATAKNVIAVGATNSDDDSMTSFSSWGPMDDGRIKPDVVAPGCESSGEGYIHSTLPGNTYGGPGWCGTSMAAPAVSGISGLIIEQYRATLGGDPLPSTVKALLIQTAVDLDNSTSYYNPGPDYASGYGRVNAQAAVDEVIAQHIREDQVSNGQMDSFTFNVPAGTPSLKVTLVWDDEPGTVNANPALVNNLDLVLVEPNGTTTRLPWVLNPANPSANATTGVDHVNNIEQVRVNNPAAGTWEVRVTGTSVPMGPQWYSLVGQTFVPGGTGNVGPLEYNAHIIDDDNSNNSSGNNDGIVNPGETIELYVELLNAGLGTANIVNACISEGSPYVDGFLYNTCSNYGDLPGGSAALNTDDFDFTVDINAPHDHTIPFTITATATNGGPWTDTFGVTVLGDSPHLYIEPPDQDVPLSGGPFMVEVVIENVSDLGAFEFHLIYGRAIVHVDDVALGPFLGSTGRSVSELGPVIDNVTGSTAYGAFSFGGGPGPSGSGIVAVVTLSPTAAGESDLILQDEVLIDPVGSVIPSTTSGGHVTVTDCFFADVDCDLDVDIVDVVLVASRYGCALGDDCYSPIYDLDSDGDVDIADLQIVACYWGWPNGDFSICYTPTVLGERSLEGEGAFNVWIEPDTYYTDETGEVFTATVEIANTNNLGAFQFDLTYDPSMVQVNNVMLGDFLGSTGRTVYEVGPTIDNSAGKVNYGACTLGSSPNGPDGDGTLAAITLETRAVGNIALDLEKVLVTDIGGYPLSSAENIYLPIIQKNYP